MGLSCCCSILVYLPVTVLKYLSRNNLRDNGPIISQAQVIIHYCSEIIVILALPGRSGMHVLSLYLQLYSSITNQGNDATYSG